MRVSAETLIFSPVRGEASIHENQGLRSWNGRCKYADSRHVKEATTVSDFLKAKVTAPSSLSLSTWSRSLFPRRPPSTADAEAAAVVRPRRRHPGRFRSASGNDGCRRLDDAHLRTPAGGSDPLGCRGRRHGNRGCHRGGGNLPDSQLLLFVGLVGRSKVTSLHSPGFREWSSFLGSGAFCASSSTRSRIWEAFSSLDAIQEGFQSGKDCFRACRSRAAFLLLSRAPLKSPSFSRRPARVSVKLAS